MIVIKFDSVTRLRNTGEKNAHAQKLLKWSAVWYIRLMSIACNDALGSSPLGLGQTSPCVKQKRFYQVRGL